MNAKGMRSKSLLVALVGSAALLALLGLVMVRTSGVSAATTSVTVGRSDPTPRDIFIPDQITINTGDTVQWNWGAGVHNVTDFASAWNSPLLSGAGQSYSRLFSSTGVQWYYCTIHAQPSDIDTNGNGTPGDGGDSPNFSKMIGKITVNLASTATPGPTSTPAPLPAASASANYEVLFTQQPALELSLSQTSYGFSNVSPAQVSNSAANALMANVKSNGGWSLKFKSIGFDGVDQAPADAGYDDGVFKNTNAPPDQIPVGRLGVAQDGTNFFTTTVADQVLTSGPQTSASGTDVGLEFRLGLDYADPVGNGSQFKTTLLFTATSP